MARRKKGSSGTTSRTQNSRAKANTPASSDADSAKAADADTVTSTTASDDTVAAEAQSDTLAGAEGTDTPADVAADSMPSDDGDDTIAGAQSDDDVAAPQGDYTIDSAQGDDTIAGAQGDDTLAADTSVETPEPAADPAPDQTADDTKVEAKADTPDQPEPAPVAQRPDPTPPAPQIIKETTIERKGGVVPMVIGGAIAAALGYGVSEYMRSATPDTFRDTIQATVDTQGTDLTALTGRVDANATAVGDIDLEPLRGAATALETSVATLQTSVTSIEGSLSTLQGTVTGLDTTTASLTADLASTTTALEALDTRLTALEKRPVAEAVGPEVIAAYERELNALKDAIVAQQAELDATVTPEAVAALQKDLTGVSDALTGLASTEALTTVQTDITALKEALTAQEARITEVSTEALTLRDDAEAKADMAEAMTLVATVTGAVTAGEPFAETLAELAETGVSIPDILSDNAETGVPSMTTLTGAYPPAARDALAIARREAAAQGNGGVTAFFENALGARSVTPREGSGPDAVLSRAEAAVRSADLGNALAEISELPEPVRAALDDWVAQAQLRQDALAATAALAQNVNQQ